MERKKASGDLPSVPLRPPASSDTFLKDVQAAFKRHRSLGTMPSTQLRARRIPVPQLSGKGDGSGDSASPANPDDSSSSALSVSGTISDPDKKDDGAVEGSALVNASSQGNGEVALRDNCRMKTTEPNGPGNQGMGISGWMSMAKIQVGSTPGPEQVNVPDMSLLKVGSLEKVTQQHQNAQHMDPVTQCSTVGSSCATTMSMHSGPTAQSTHAAFAMQTALTPMARHGVERSGIAQGYAGMDYASRGLEIPGGLKESCSNGVVGRKEADAALVAPQPQVGLERNPSNVDGDPSTKPEKVRKKKYDPDMFFKVNGKLYQRLGKIGSGGSSEVYKVISSDCTIYALKRIKLKGRDYPTAHGFYQEIEYLNKLKGKNNIIELVDYELTDKTLLEEVQSGTLSNKDGKIRDDTLIYMVLEYGEIDLAHMLSQKWKEIKNMKLHENWLRFYWQQMLEAVNTIHEERIVHSDLKPANFLLVKGSLKLIDFGIAKAITSDTTNIQRDAQVGTLNYMSPEAFMWNEKDGNGNTIKCGRPSDIWSLGCILYQMVYGKTPFADFKTFWAKFKVITDRNHKIEYGPISNPWLIDLMKKCLSWDRDERWRIPQLLQHPFLNPPMPPLEVTDQS